MIRTQPVRHVLVSLAAVPLLLMAGCLERIESITIKDDGSAALSTEFRGQPGDYTKPADAVPEQGGAWAVTESREKNMDGKERIIRTATLSVPAGGAFPASYAAAGDPRAESGLKFPTTLRVTRSGPNTYYDLVRTYQRREEAKYAYHAKKITDTGEFKKLAEADANTLTDEQRLTLARGLAWVEALKQAQFIEAGAAAMEADGTWPQEVGLTLRRTALDYADAFNMDQAIALLRQPQSEERDAAIQKQADAFTQGLRESVLAALKKLSIPSEQGERFLAAAKKEAAMRAATEDLADERWEVRVKMPGTVSAHNADRVEDGNVLVWDFEAQAIYDRDHVLRATSFVPSTQK